MTKAQLLQLYSDRGYELPRLFVPERYFGKPYCQLGYYGGINFLNEDAREEFFGLKKAKPMYTLTPEEKKARKALFLSQCGALVTHQERMFYCLKDELCIPFEMRFFQMLCTTILKPEYDYRRRKDYRYPEALFFLMSLTGFMLIYNFGGAFALHKHYGLVVELDKVPLDIHLYLKLYGSELGDYGDWMFHLMNRLWLHTLQGELLDTEDLGFVVKRRS